MKRMILSSTSLANFKSKYLGQKFGNEECNRVYKLEHPRYGSYFVAVNYTQGYGYCGLYAEDIAGNQVTNDDVNVEAFGTTKSDFEDSFFWL